MFRHFIVPAAIVLLASLGCSFQDAVGETEGLRTRKPALGDWGVATRNISKTVKPGDDFFTYVNEGWIQSARIPAGASDFGAFDELGRKTEERITTIIQDAAKAGGRKNDSLRMIGDLYASFTDTDRIERLGLSPIQGDLTQILASRRVKPNLP